MQTVKYLGPLQDYSGYGEANRHDVAALEAAGVTVCGELVSYVREVSDFGSIGQAVNATINRTADCRIKILHTTPDQYRRFMEVGKYHIGRFFWETDLVPQEFADGLQLMDEIWTGSQANADAIAKAGVTRPVKIIPQAIETEREWPEPYEVPGTKPSTFLFYSIFEWTDRKNPKALLEAYWREFQGGENVGLIIKTYFRDFSFNHKNQITANAQELKRRSGLSQFPPVYLYKELMDRRQVMRLHKTGDCFVSAHRGEGWGLPQVEAALAGNPIISTGYGGCHEYFTDGLDASLVEYSMVPLSGMEHSSKWYTPDQNWAEADIAEIRRSMRAMYDHRSSAQKMGKRGQSTVRTKFNLSTVGGLMKQRLSEIEAIL